MKVWWVAAALVMATAAPAPAATLPVPAPVAPTLLPGIGATADRLRVSVLPAGATANDDESVGVTLSGDGSPQAVTVDQRISLAGRGDYVVVERGPARRAQVLGDGDPPTVKAGAVLYAGFLPPTGRLLSAHLTLDPAYETARLPLGVRLSFHRRGAAEGKPLGAAGRVAGPGYVEITLTASSTSIVPLAAADAPAAALAGPLDTLHTAAATIGDRPPVAGDGLPAGIRASGTVVQTVATVPAPLRLSVTASESGADGRTFRDAVLAGPGVTPGGDAATGVLADSTTLRLTVPRAGRVHLSIQALPALDPRTVAPPAGNLSWKAWAAGMPDAAARRAAVDQLEFAAAEAAQIRVVSPYLTTGLPGVVHTRFELQLGSNAAAPAHVPLGLTRRPLGITVISLAALLVLVNLELLRRRL